MKSKKYLPLLIFLIAFALRSINLEGLTTFEWDQARDVVKMSEILSGNFTLIGPVVKGEGNFFLGPLYHYIASVFLLFSRGEPLALSYLSIFLDSLCAAGVYYLFSLLSNSKSVGVFGSFIWMFSSHLISLSHTPWNVSLLQIWILSMLYFWYKSKNGGVAYLLPLAFLSTISLHIHLSLAIILAILLLSRISEFAHLDRKYLLLSIFFLFLPVSPLILFDVRHSFLNSSLFIKFLSSNNIAKVPIVDFIPTLLIKLDYTISELFFGSRIKYLGLLIYALSLISSLAFVDKKVRLVMFFLTIQIPALLLLYRDPGFAEYYFLPLYIPMLYSLSDGVFKLFKNTKYIPLFILAIIVGLNILSFNFSTHPFSLKNKSDLADFILDYSHAANLRLELPLGRRDGIEYLYQLRGGTISDPSDTIAVVTESDKFPSVKNINEISSRSFDGLKATIFVVQ